jgi:NTP pyrophosphatase (non-canonical NTP hydrolase)
MQMVTKEQVERAKFAADVAADILIIAGVAGEAAAKAAADAAWNKYVKLKREYDNESN